MKKVIAFLLVSVLLVTLMAPAFAGPVEMCPDCSGALISMTTSGYYDNVKLSSFFCPFYLVYYVQTTTIVCTNNVHKHTTRVFIKRSTEPFDGWI